MKQRNKKTSVFLLTKEQQERELEMELHTIALETKFWRDNNE